MSEYNSDNTIYGNECSDVLETGKFKIELATVLHKAMKVPGIKINREKFLKKELAPRYSEEIVKTSVKYNPAFAGINREEIDSIANSAITYETTKVTAISFVSGIPGGTAIPFTATADVVQYFGSMLRIMQKLAYLYGFEDFELDEESIPDETMNELIIFLGIMFGVQEAGVILKEISQKVSAKISKDLARKPLTQTFYYPGIAKIARSLGFQMNKQIFSNKISGLVPVISAFIIGGMSYSSFKPSARRLQNNFKELSICDPNTYRKQTNT